MLKGRTRKINGLPVVDATDSVILKVSTKDIAVAKKKSQGECAAAIACVRQLHATEARVHLGRTYVRYNGKWKRYITSAALRDELVAFDRGGSFTPGPYTLISMQPSRAWDRKYRQNQAKKKVKRQSRRAPHRTIVSGVRPIGIYA